MSHAASPPLLEHFACIAQLLRVQAVRTPAALAVLAPGRQPLTYSRLWREVDAVVQTLRVLGLGRQDRIALVLPNGPELAVAFLAVAAGATCVPLNPTYSAHEYALALTDFRIQALMIQEDMPSPARVVAQRHGLRLIELRPRHAAAAGLFTLTGEHERCAERAATPPDYTQPDDVAIVLQTSGTTSHPKIVPLTHRNLCASAVHVRGALGLGTADRYLNVVPLFHASGLVIGLLGSLSAGGSVVCPHGFEAAAFFPWLADFRPTWYMGVSAIHQAILAHAPAHQAIIARCPLRFIRAGAAALPLSVEAALEQTFQVPVLGSYGMTETNLIACNPLPPLPRKRGSVGVAAGPDVAIMSSEGTLLPCGETGEIVVRGPNVMPGYEHNPTANRESFTHGWFRTGDEGWLDADGYLFITGRLKEMINRGGLKVTPQEVDEACLAHPAVAHAVTFAVPHSRWGEDVVTAVVVQPHITVTEQELRQFVATRLAPFKVPSQILTVPHIPVGPTGKVQRRYLPEQLGLTGATSGQPGSPRTVTEPRTPLEEVLSGLWATVLGLERVGVSESFFQLGGDSILATQLLSRIRETLHLDIAFRDFFGGPSVAEVARHLAIGQQSTALLAEPPLRAVDHAVPMPLSYAQQRLWFLEQLGLSRHAYHLLDAVYLDGPLHIHALTQSLQTIVERHDILRTIFTSVSGVPQQVIALPGPLPIVQLDWQHLATAEQQRQVESLAQAEVRRAFDLTQGPVLRVTLVCLAADAYVLLVAMHHIVSDAWSHMVFWQELAALYRAHCAGELVSIPPLTLQYADVAHWQQAWVQGEMLAAHLAYWKQQLAGVPPLQLPTDHARPAVQTFRGARQALRISPELTSALKTLSQRHGVTLFMTLLAVWQTVLHRYTAQDDIVVGALIANRNRVEVEGLIGFFVNTLVLRTDLSGDPSFSALLARVRTVTLEAYEHQDLPYEKLLEALRPARDLSRNPLFQVLLAFHNTPRQVYELPGLTVRALEIDPGTARFDITLEFWETPTGLQGRFEYSTALFEAATIARMAGHVQTLLAGVVAEPEQRLSRLPLLTAPERQRLLVEWNTTAMRALPELCIHRLFEHQAARTPDAVAVVCEHVALTYRELNAQANQVAHYLATLGVGRTTLVGLCIERSLALVVGLFGILKAGAAYIPLDPTYPRERLAFMLADARPPVVVTQAHLVTALPDHGARMVCLDTDWPGIALSSSENPPGEVMPEDVAYLLYTSGSTGTPKGVLGVHRATVNALAWMWHTYPLAPHEVCCQKTPVSFGDSIQEVFGPLLQGTPLVLIPDHVLKDLPRFVHTLALHHVTRLILVPSLLRTLLDTFSDLSARLPELTLWFAGGEALPRTLWEHFRTCLPHGRLINLYGASEASDDTTWYEASRVPDGLPGVPIGRPIANTQVYVLDAHLQPVPLSIPGELYVGGAGLTHGYRGQPALTAERFLPDPFSGTPGARLYRTGDVVRYQADGALVYLGRLDHQIKLRGIRIELGEIEAALRQHPAIREVVVMLQEALATAPHLVAYIVPARVPGPTRRALRRFLEQHLPTAMVPAVFVMLTALPLTPSGKVDRRQLPVPDAAWPALAEAYVAPRTSVEQQLASIWGHVLGRERVGVHDNFFELGGHSLLAMQMLARVQDATAVTVSLVHFFEAPTVEGMARRIEAGQPTTQPPVSSGPVALPRTGRLAASIAQEHFWFFAQLLPDLPLFTIPYVVRLHGALDVTALEQSVQALIQRHETLRTTFASVDEQLVQVIAPTLRIPLTVHDLRARPAAVREAEARALLQEASQRPLPMEHGPLLQADLVRTGDQEHYVLVTLHHSISDGWSLGVFMRELALLYDAIVAGQPSPLPVLPLQYADVAAWQRQWQHNPALVAQLAYWQAQFREPLPALDLPTDYPREAPVYVHTARQTLVLSDPLYAALLHRSQHEECTLFMTCLAALNILLYHYTGQEDLCVATLVANRTRPETEGLIGLLVNTVLLRTHLGNNPLCQEILQRVRAATLGAYAHQELPFEEVVSNLERTHSLQRTSLSPIMVVWQHAALWPQQLCSRTLTFETMEQSLEPPGVSLTTFDIVLTLRERPHGLLVTCLYKTALFAETTVLRMLEEFQAVLTSLCEQPERRLATFRTL